MTATLANELYATLTDVLPADAVPTAADVERACEPLPGLGWSPLMLRRWAEHADWSDVTSGEVLERVAALGLPAERPRSAEPVRGDLCPTDGSMMRAGVCDECAAAARRLSEADIAVRVAMLRRSARAARSRHAVRGVPVGADKDVQ